MDKKEIELLQHAAALLDAEALSLREGHNVDHRNPDWKDEPEAKAAHDDCKDTSTQLYALAEAATAAALSCDAEKERGDAKAPDGQIDANKLEQLAKERPDECFLKGSGILKLTGAIRALEQEIRSLKGQSLPADAERKVQVLAFETAIKDFVSGYEIDTGEGIYQPNEHERFLIDMALRDALHDDDFAPAIAAIAKKGAA